MAVAFVKSCVAGRRRSSSGLQSVILNHLSSEGVAKLNREALGGGDLVETLKELTEVYQLFSARKQFLAENAPSPCKEIIAKYTHLAGRALSLDEMTALAHLPCEWVESTITQRVQEEGQTVDLVLENLAFEFKFQQLHWDAETVKRNDCLGRSVRIAQLNPTSFCAPSSFSSPSSTPSFGSLSPPSSPTTPVTPLAIPVSLPMSPSMVRMEEDHVKIGLSPVVVWFRDQPSEFGSKIIEQFTELKNQQTVCGTTLSSRKIKTKPTSLSIRVVRFDLPDDFEGSESEAESSSDATGKRTLTSPLGLASASSAAFPPVTLDLLAADENDNAHTTPQDLNSENPTNPSGPLGSLGFTSQTRNASSQEASTTPPSIILSPPPRSLLPKNVHGFSRNENTNAHKTSGQSGGTTTIDVSNSTPTSSCGPRTPNTEFSQPSTPLKLDATLANVN